MPLIFYWSSPVVDDALSRFVPAVRRCTVLCFFFFSSFTFTSWNCIQKCSKHRLLDSICNFCHIFTNLAVSSKMANDWIELNFNQNSKFKPFFLTWQNPGQFASQNWSSLKSCKTSSWSRSSIEICAFVSICTSFCIFLFKCFHLCNQTWLKKSTPSKFQSSTFFFTRCAKFKAFWGISSM